MASTEAADTAMSLDLVPVPARGRSLLTFFVDHPHDRTRFEVVMINGGVKTKEGKTYVEKRHKQKDLPSLVLNRGTADVPGETVSHDELHEHEAKDLAVFCGYCPMGLILTNENHPWLMDKPIAKYATLNEVEKLEAEEPPSEYYHDHIKELAHTKEGDGNGDDEEEQDDGLEQMYRVYAPLAGNVDALRIGVAHSPDDNGVCSAHQIKKEHCLWLPEFHAKNAHVAGGRKIRDNCVLVLKEAITELAKKCKRSADEAPQRSAKKAVVPTQRANKRKREPQTDDTDTGETQRADKRKRKPQTDDTDTGDGSDSEFVAATSPEQDQDGLSVQTRSSTPRGSPQLNDNRVQDVSEFDEEIKTEDVGPLTQGVDKDDVVTELLTNGLPAGVCERDDAAEKAIVQLEEEHPPLKNLRVNTKEMLLFVEGVHKSDMTIVPKFYKSTLVLFVRGIRGDPESWRKNNRGLVDEILEDLKMMWKVEEDE